MIKFQNQLISSDEESAKIFVTGDITEETVVELTKDLELCKNSGVKKIVFCINSPGGSVSDGMALYDLVVSLNSIETEAEIQGLCASAATYLPLACDTIKIHKNSDMMLHEPEGGFWGTLDTATADLEYFSTLRDRIIALYCSRTGLSVSEIEDILKAAQFLNAKRCKELNLVDEIIGELEPETKEEESDEGSSDEPSDEGSSDEVKDEGSEEAPETTDEAPTNKVVFSLKNLVNILKLNNISFLKASDDEFAAEVDVINTLTEKVKDLENKLDAKEKSYNEIVNRLEDTTKEIEKRVQMEVANKVAQFGFSPDKLPAPVKNKKVTMSQDEFRNKLKEIYATQGYKAAEDFANRYEQENQ